MLTASMMVATVLIGATPVESRFDQVTPEPPLGKMHGRSKGQDRAVVLIHGLYLHPFSSRNVSKPKMRDWQYQRSLLVRQVSEHADVFAFAYGQDAPVDKIIERSGFASRIKMLKRLGYKEIVLVGHSAGGLLARQFVEDHPKSGVTRVIQVCSPNGGSDLAKYAIVRKEQKEFVRSLTQEAQKKWQESRKKPIPKEVDFVCLLGTGAGGKGDGLVKCHCVWTEGLQKQGIPIVSMNVTHWRAMRSRASIDVIVEHIKKKHPRWQPKKVTTEVEKLFPND